MEDLLTCSICFEPYNIITKVPVGLICGHTFCRSCLVLINQKKGVTACPLDNINDTREISLIPKNYSLLEILNLTNSKSQSNQKPEVQKHIESCTLTLALLEKFKSISEEQRSKSIENLSNGFNRLRGILGQRESELLGQIEASHSVIRQKIESSLTETQILLQIHEESLKQIDQNKKGEVVSDLPDTEKIDEIVLIIQNLPIKVLCGVQEVEKTVLGSCKIIDDTHSRVSDLKVSFVADVRVKERTRFLPNSTFVKTWRVKNEGNEAWPVGCWCVFSHGEFGGDDVVVDPAWPDEEIDVSVLLSAPAEVGVFKSFWKLVDPNGLTFGPTLLAEIEVYNVD